MDAELSDNVTFEAHIMGHPGDILTQESPGCDWNVSLTNTITIQCGCFSAQWNAGETLYVQATDDNGYYACTAVLLTEAGYQYLPYGMFFIEGDSYPFSIYDLTIVELDDFISVSWTVENEESVSSWNVYRFGLISSIDAVHVSEPYTYEIHHYSGTPESSYWIEAVLLEGGTIQFGPLSVEASSGNDELPVNHNYQLTNHPNPFNGETTISFSLTTNSPEKAEIEIYNVKGQIVDQLAITNYELGSNQVTYSADKLSSGVYFYKLIVDGKAIDTKKMVLVK